VCGLAGAPLPKNKPLDSADMLPLLTGASHRAVHENLFWNFPSFGAAVAAGDWKLVVSKKGAPELFNLATDIGEKNDLAAARPEEVRRLTQLLDNWLAQTVTPLWGPGSKKNPGAKTAAAAVPRGDLIGETEK